LSEERLLPVGTGGHKVGTMVGRISCFSAFRTTKKHARNGGALPGDAPSGRAPVPHNRNGTAPPVAELDNSEIPGGLAGIRERMAAMGHFVMTPEALSRSDLSEVQPEGPVLSAVGGTTPAKKRKKERSSSRDSDGPAGPGDLMVSADLCDEDGRPMQTHATSPSQQPPKQPDEDDKKVHEMACTLFPGREEVQRLHAQHFFPSGGPSPTSGQPSLDAPSAMNSDEVMFEADGDGETEAERLLNAFATPGRAPAVVKRSKIQSPNEMTDATRQAQSAHIAGGAPGSGPSHQTDDGSALLLMAQVTNANGTSRGGPLTPRAGGPMPPRGAAESMSPALDDGNQSQRKTAISQLITTQGIRASELRGNWAEVVQQPIIPHHSQPSSPGGHAHRATSLQIRGNTPRTPDSSCSGPSPARGPAWRDAGGPGRAATLSSSSVSTARSASGASSNMLPASPRDVPSWSAAARASGDEGHGNSSSIISINSSKVAAPAHDIGSTTAHKRVAPAHDGSSSSNSIQATAHDSNHRPGLLADDAPRQHHAPLDEAARHAVASPESAPAQQQQSEDETGEQQDSPPRQAGAQAHEGAAVGVEELPSQDEVETPPLTGAAASSSVVATSEQHARNDAVLLFFWLPFCTFTSLTLTRTLNTQVCVARRDARECGGMSQCTRALA